MSNHTEHLKRRAYRRYITVCFTRGQSTMTYKRFSESIDRLAARYIATELAEQVKVDKGDKAVYVARRLTEMPEVTSGDEVMIIKQCDQCQEDVGVDPGMKKFLDQSEIVICSACIPEVTGNTMDDIVTTVLNRLGEV